MAVRVGFLQFDPAYLDHERNLRQCEKLLEGIEADLLVLPELFNSGYFFQSTEDALRSAEPVPTGPTTRWIIDQAARRKMTIVAGLPERTGASLFNSAVVVGPQGFIGTYRKTHLFYQENVHFRPGDTGLPVFELVSRGGETYRLGVMICFDWYFPEAARTLALKGADIIAHPSNLVLPHCPRAMPVRAIENHVFTITANRYGQESNGEESLTFIGKSLICAPDGTVVVQAPTEGDTVRVVFIDPSEARRRALNAYNDWMKDRRPAVYSAGKENVALT